MNTSHTINTDVGAEALQSALTGDIKQLNPSDRLKFLAAVCQSMKLNPLTKPFDFVELNGKLKMYANAGCAEQLRTVHCVSIEVTERFRDKGIYAVRVKAKTHDGRTDEAIGIVPCADNASGEFLANAMMKAETKAKRRVTFSICGLAFPDLDEMRVDGMKPAHAEVTDGESAQDKAARLNAMISTAHIPAVDPGEHKAPEPAITLAGPDNDPAGASLPEPKTIDPDWTVEMPQSVTVKQPEPEPGAIDDTTASQIESIIGTLPDPSKAVPYLVAKGKLPKGKGIEHINADYAGKILANPRGWMDAVIKASK